MGLEQGRLESDDCLKAESNATTEGARRLHEVNCAAILPEYRDIALREQVAHFNDKIHAAG